MRPSVTRRVVVSERKTQSPLIWLKYQKTELPKPGATWLNTPFKDFARCVGLTGVGLFVAEVD